jgi:protein-disulfide isomerase
MGKKFFNIKFFLAVFVFAAVSFTAMAFFWKKNSHKAPEVRDYTVTQSGLAELLVKPTELVLGDINAPITLISYDSFSCIHCAEFYKHTFKNLEENYIKTGKVKFVHRDLPLDKVAKDITQVFACLKEKNEIDAQK